MLDNITLPPNSIARASIPQVDILRLMNCRDLFVHHGGQNSVMEGGYAGIPMVVSLVWRHLQSFSKQSFSQNVSLLRCAPPSLTNLLMQLNW